MSKDSKLERGCTASAIAILNREQELKALDEMSKSLGTYLDVIVLPSDTEVTISFNVGGDRNALKPIVFHTSKCYE